jgi:hypothetical protein
MHIRLTHETTDHDAEELRNVFSWINESGVRETPRLQVMQEGLQLAGKDDTELNEYIEDVESVSCGKVFLKPREKGKEPAKNVQKNLVKYSPENWTHMDYSPEFDPNTDEVPENLSWKPFKE